MKAMVRIITAAAFLAIIVGGSALDSKSTIVPALMILPALAWLGLIVLVNARCHPRGRRHHL